MEAVPKDSAPPKIIDSTGADPKTIRAEGWVMPKAPYPYQARASHEQGTVTLEIIQGADGRVVKATVVKSKDHPVLNERTAKWAYAKWSGPPNHKMTVPVTYQLR